MDEASPRLQELETELARLREELAALRGASFPGHLLRALLEQTPDQVYFKDLQSRFILASRAVAQSFRIEDPNDLKGRTDFDFFSETHARQAYEDEQEILRTGLPKVAMEEVETWPDGRSTWVSTTKAPLKDPSGNVLGTFGISRNITNHKQAEFALKTSEERLRMLFDHAVDGILMGSPAGLILHANAVACDMAGRTQEELLGLPIARLFTPESLAATPLRFDLLQEGLRVVSERALLRQDGSSLPIEMHTKMMPDGTYQAIVRDISERKQAERALQASETHYRELLEGLQEGFAFTDTEERFVFVNPAASAIFGVPEGLQGHLLQEFLLPEVFQEVLERTEARKRGENGQYELPIRRPDGESRVIALSVSPWRNEAGDYLGTRGLFQDITERKRAEKALRESENNFRSLLERLGEGFAIVDPEERWTFANSATARTFGVEPGDLVGHRLREFVDEDTYQEILRQTERRRRGESSTYEIRIRRRDGAIRHVLLSASPYLGENGEYLGADGLFMDVTERRLAENALQESRERYLDLFNNTADAIFWFRLQPHGGLMTESINPTLEEWLGRTSAQVAGRPLPDTFPRALAASLEQQCRQCVAAGHPVRYDNVVGEGPGARTFQTLLVPIRDDQRRIGRIVGFAQDITQHLQAEEALRQAQKLESLGVLAGGIAHDFNNLLTAILGNLNLAQMKLSPESPALPNLENMERTVLKAAELTKQMLAYSGKGRFLVKPHDLNQVVQEMTHLLQVSISKKVHIHYDLAPDLPIIEADAAQIQQVVMNLVTNASEAIGDREGIIGIATRRLVLGQAALQSSFAGQNLEPGAHAVLEVSDTGSGIAPEIMDRIFDPFFSTKQSGRGLGLSAMQGILRGHRAGIQISSVPGRGSTFTLLFPIGAESSPLKLDDRTEPPMTPLRGRILLVDDEAEVRTATAGMLEALGLQVATARDGQEALDRFQAEQGRIDLVLLDLTMPRMDGRETFRELRKLQGNLPVILFSGYSEHESLQETLAQGRAGFLQKPFLLSDLRTAILQVWG
jgi:PAS domain S-box-containing protein